MNTINNTFSFSRFGAVLKRDLVENRKRYLVVFFIMFAAFLVYQLKDMKDIIELGQLRAYESAEYMARLATDCLPFFYGVLVLALICAAADMTGVPLRSKTISTNYLMMPASNIEKFLSRALINTVVVIVMAYVALFCADLVRMLCVPLFDVEYFYGFTVPRALVAWTEPLKEIYIVGASGYEIINNEIVYPYWEKDLAIMAVSFVVILTLWAHSLFVLGGCFWRKAALIKMFLTGLVATLIVVWICIKLEPLLGPWFAENVWPWIETKFETEREFNRFIFPIGIPLFLGFIALNWWLSFRLFSRKQVVARTHLFGGKHPHHLFNKAHS